MNNRKLYPPINKTQAIKTLQDYIGVGELIAEFTSYQQWISKKQSKLSNMANSQTLLYIDAEGLACYTDQDFEDACYPVKVFLPVGVNE